MEQQDSLINESSPIKSNDCSQKQIKDQSGDFCVFEGQNATNTDLRSLRVNQFNEMFIGMLDQRLQQEPVLFNYTKDTMEQDPKYIAPHIKIGLGVIRPIVLVVGDPFRCEDLAKLCEEYKEIQWNREYRTYNATYQGAELTIASHGIGGPGAAICFEELIKIGATTIIRLGTCGAMQEHIKTGDLIVATAACREDGYTQFIVPQEFPAVGDQKLTLALFNQAKEMGLKVHQGVCLTSALFYEGKAIPSTMKVHANAGAVMVEMEIAALFTIGTTRGIRTAALATSDGNDFIEGDYDPHGTLVAEGKINMMKVGLKVARQEIRQSAKENQQEFFDEKLRAQYMKVYKKQHLMDYLDGKKENQLSMEEKKTIVGLVSKGSFVNFAFYLDQATNLSEQEIQELVILYHKVQRNLDDTFYLKLKDYGEK